MAMFNSDTAAAGRHLATVNSHLTSGRGDTSLANSNCAMVNSHPAAVNCDTTAVNSYSAAVNDASVDYIVRRSSLDGYIYRCFDYTRLT